MKMNVCDLACARGGIPILEGVSFSLNAGDSVTIRGANGIGKTTLLRTLAGLQPALAGQIDIPPDSIAYAAHADGIKATLSVQENLSFWMRIYGQKDITPAIHSMKLDALRDRLAHSLSAGQRRRLGLARLFLTQRPIWILDEPTVSLDQEGVALFADAIRHHTKSGGMAIMATHIDLGLGTESHLLDLTPFIATGSNSMIDEAFL